MSFIETIPEEDIKLLAQRLGKYLIKDAEEITDDSIKRTYSVKEVCNITGRHEHTIRSHIKNELLEAKKSGNKFIITSENLKKYIGNGE